MSSVRKRAELELLAGGLFVLSAVAIPALVPDLYPFSRLAMFSTTPTWEERLEVRDDQGRLVTPDLTELQTHDVANRHAIRGRRPGRSQRKQGVPLSKALVSASLRAWQHREPTAPRSLVVAYWRAGKVPTGIALVERWQMRVTSP